MAATILLENQRVRLSLLTTENAQLLHPVASQPGLVRYSPSEIETPEALNVYVLEALEQAEMKRAIPFIIYDKKTASYAGSTRYMNIDWENKVLHIGATWMGREYHGSGLNLNIKFLMLQYAFETMGFEKVEFRIDERNLRSRRAVEKLGAILEGILRSNVYLPDGYKRNTCCYGILNGEWDTLKSGLSRRLE